jgi:TolA-binding protein
LLNAYSETEDPEIASHLIEVLLTQGQQQEARELLARMIQQYPEDPSLKSVQKKIIDI